MAPSLDPLGSRANESSLGNWHLDLLVREPASAPNADELRVRIWHRPDRFAVVVAQDPVVDETHSASSWPVDLDYDFSLAQGEDSIWYVELFLVDSTTGASYPNAPHVVAGDFLNEMIAEGDPGGALWDGVVPSGAGPAGAGGTGSTGTGRVPRIPPPPPPVPTGL